jgi:hypothetical protein
MGWPFGLSKKKIEQIPPSQTGTGTPGDLSWIDERRRKVAELKKKQEARFAEEAKKIELRETRLTILVAAELTRLLPPGVELVGLPRVDIYKAQANARISLGNGVQFSLRFCFPSGLMEYAYDVAILEAGEDRDSDGAYLGGKMFLEAPPWRLSMLRFTKTEMKDVLFEALEKHDAKRASA